MNYSLDKRAQALLTYLIELKGYVKIQDIADEMNISKRSVYYNINRINEWLESNHIESLVSQRNKGVFMSSEKALQIRELLEDQSNDIETIVFTPHERLCAIICYVTVRSKPMYIEDFMDLVQVSRNTIINDIKSVQKALEKYNLTWEYDIKHGYHVGGDIIKKRAIFFMLFPDLLKYVENGILPIQDGDFDYDDVLNELKTIENELQAEYVRDVLPTLAMFITTINKRNETIDYHDVDADEIASTMEFTLVQKYFDKIKLSEQLYITLHLLGSRLQTIPMTITSKQDDEALELSKLLVREFERISCIYFDKEDELVKAISAHLKTSLYRYKYGIQLGNPMLTDIKNEYTELFELTKKSCKVIEDKIEVLISDPEVAYLTLHFGAFLQTSRVGSAKQLRIGIICPNGIGTGNMLFNEVSDLVPENTMIENIPFSQYDPKHNYDVLISTIYIQNEEKLIVVHPILTDQDRVAILRHCMVAQPKEMMGVQEIIKIAQNYIPAKLMNEFKKDLEEYYSTLKIQQAPHKDFGAGLLSYLVPGHIQLIKDLQTWQDALRLSCVPLLKNDSIEYDYVQAILEDQTERGLSMFLGDGIVLAHAAIEKGVKKLDVSFNVFKQPVHFWNDQEARIIIALCAEDQTKHMKILNDVLTLFSKRKTYEQLVSLNTETEIRELIETIIAE